MNNAQSTSVDYVKPEFKDEAPYFSRYENLDTHWFKCRCCGGISWDSDTAALAGLSELSPENVTHDLYCPGFTFPSKYVYRVKSIH